MFQQSVVEIYGQVSTRNLLQKQKNVTYVSRRKRMYYFMLRNKIEERSTLLHYNRHLEITEGFTDYGNTGRLQVSR